MDADLVSWLNTTFMSHGHCYLWRPDLVLLHVLSDSIIALAYYSIPFALWRLKQQRTDLEFGWMLALFALFIFACGTTHLVNIWNIWFGHYYFSGAVKLLTATVSMLTAILIWPLIPKLLALPKPSELAAANEDLRAEIGRREVSERALLETQQELERKLKELTDTKTNLEREIAERKRLEADREAQNLALRRSNEELEQFASIASHDLREPLRKILSFSQMLNSGRYGSFTEQGSEFVASIGSAAQRMEALLNSLFEYSRVSSQQLVVAQVPLAETVKEVCKDLQMQIEESGATIECGELATVPGDRVLLRQLMQNLISNSLKYRREEVPPVIRIEGRQLDDAWYQLTLKDNGIGFDLRYRERIFELFRRLHGRTEYSGTGVGLAICRRTVVRHGGRIDVHSVPGQGSDFTITLPLREQRVRDSENALISSFYGEPLPAK